MEQGVWLVQPQSYGSSYFVKCENDTYNTRNNVLVLFCINTLSLLYCLRLQGGGSYSPLAPLNLPLGRISKL